MKLTSQILYNQQGVLKTKVFIFISCPQQEKVLRRFVHLKGVVLLTVCEKLYSLKKVLRISKVKCTSFVCMV